MTGQPPSPGPDAGLDDALRQANDLMIKARFAEVLELMRGQARLNPGVWAVHAQMAEALERLGRLDEALEACDRALALAPGQLTVHVLAAGLLRRLGRPAEALARLKAEVKTPQDAYQEAMLNYELGRLQHGLGDHAAAFSHFAYANRLLALHHGVDDKLLDRLPGKLRALGRLVTPQWHAAWSPPPPPASPAPVFLVGFPRSGTTLMERMLMGHPGIEVLPERPMVDDLLNHAMAQTGGRPEALAGMTQAQLAQGRQLYLEASRGYAQAAPGATVVDKLPLNMLDAWVIHRYFPEARFILALRHPCDVVLSNFMQHFMVNHAMAHTLDLADCAGFYAQCFAAWFQFRQALPLPVYELRYEAVVADRAPVLRGLLEFLGLPWHDGVLDHQASAQRGAAVHTPSYDQVSQPIYAHASGRWRRYQAQMEPVLDILRPVAQTLGYELD